MRVKLFKRPIYKWRKSTSTLTRIHFLARRGTLSWVLGPVRLGLSEPFVCNSRQNPRVHLWDEKRAGSHIDLPSFSPKGGEEKGGEEQDGDISTTLQCIMEEDWYRISYKLTVIALLRITDGKNTSRVLFVGKDGSMFSQRCITTSDLFSPLTSCNVMYKVDQVLNWSASAIDLL